MDSWADGEALPALADFIRTMAALDATGEGTGGVVVVTGVELDLPVELEVRIGDDGRPRIGASPPTQIVETSVMPVLHRLAVRIDAEEGA